MNEQQLRALYDPKATSIPCGVKALWRLYALGRWDLLEEVGVDRKTHETLFRAFEENILRPHPRRLMTAFEDVRALICTAPAVLAAAISLTDKYYCLMRPVRDAITKEATL